MPVVSAERIPEQTTWYTADDFFALVRNGQKADLIDGVIYMASPDCPDDNELANFAQFLLEGFVHSRKAGKVYSSRVAFVLSEWRAPEPDIAFISRDRLGLVARTRVLGGPDIAVEVVSEDSRTRDYKEKKRLYQEAGVREYWIIDPLTRKAQFLRLTRKGYREVTVDVDGMFRSEALPGFWLKVSWLFDLPDRDWVAALHPILAGEPAGERLPE